MPRYDPLRAAFPGFPIDQLTEEHMELVDGIHIHLCEQDLEPLKRTWDKAFDYLEPFRQFKWINLGGGHHRADYQRDELVEFPNLAEGYRASLSRTRRGGGARCGDPGLAPCSTG